MYQLKPAARCYYLVVFIPLLLLCTPSYAQLTADFTANKTGGCPPGMEVNFTDATTGASATATYKWDFGNGRTSVAKSPKGVFTDIKPYTITLTVTDGAVSSTKSMVVEVYPLPTVDFTVATTRGCAPLPVNFTATAVAYSNATIATYLWDFGDGVTEQTTAATATHTYTGARTPAVSVTVTDSHGCVNISSVKSDVQVLPAVEALFTADKVVLCTTADKVTLTSNSTGPGTLSYKWDFGDGNTATDPVVAHSFNAKGEYKVKLLVTSSEGCSDAYEKPVNIANFNVDFTISSPVCTGIMTNFTGTATPEPDLLTWSFGDGGFGYGKDGANFYRQGGNQTVTLTAKYNTCNIVATKQVKVNEPPVLDGFATENQLCGAPATITFRDTSKTGAKWEWFIDNVAAGSSKSISPAFVTNRVYSISLIATDAIGCSAEVVYKMLDLKEPSAGISYISSTSKDGLKGCDDFTVHFNTYTTEKIVTYNWTFTDGGSSTEKDPTHTFTKEGHHWVKLSFVTDKGCKGAALTEVVVYRKPTATFYIQNPNPVCGNTPVLFIGTSAVDIERWIWSFEGVGSAQIERGPTPMYKYMKEGTYTVQLITDNGNGICRDTFTRTDYVKVIPPFVDIRNPQNTCQGMRNKVTFTEASRQATEWRWDFGDGKTTSYTSFKPSVTHEYEKSGKYNVVLTVIKDQCAVKDSVDAYVLLKQTPVLTVGKPEMCGNDVVSMEVNNPESNPYTDVLSYEFAINRLEYDKTGTLFTGKREDTYEGLQQYKGILSGLTVGKDSIRVLTYNYVFNCPDTSAFVKLKVKGPTAAYQFTANNVCFNTPNKFLEQSVLSDNVPVVLWNWDFGDGIKEVYTKGPEVAHTYAYPGTYHPSLKVTDKDGCYSSISSPSVNAPLAVLTGPQAKFDFSPDPVKPGSTVTYNNIIGPYNNLANTTYTWFFSYDGSTSTLPNPSRYYDKILDDKVTLVATDISSGCVDSMVKIVSVKIIQAAFSYTATYVNGNSCPPVLARFTNLSTDYKRVRWNFGDHNTGDNLNNPTHTYNKPGKYTIRLYAYDEIGGVDSADQEIEIKGPLSSFVADATKICGVPATVRFTANPLNVTDFTWDFADGTVAGSKNFDTAYTYTLPGAYKPAIIVKDALGCSAVFELGDPFVIDTLHIAFSKTPAVICDSANVRFTPAVVNIGADQLNLPLTWHWDFGTGNPDDTANSKAPVFKYKGLGGETFKAHLTVHSDAGCVEEAEEIISIVRKTRGSVAAVPEICQYQSVDFEGTANGPVHSWKWEFADNGATAADQTEVSHLYNNGGDYKVLLVVEHQGCTDTTMHLLTVHTLPEVALASKNVLLCLGDSAVLQAHNGVQYQWSPAIAITDAAIDAPAVFPVSDTRYKVVVTNQYGCINKDSLLVKLSYPFTIASMYDTTVCQGEKVQLTANGAVTYKWIEGKNLDNTSIADPIATAVVTNDYAVVGYGNDACFTDTARFKLTVRPLPVIKGIGDTSLVAGSSVPLTTAGSNDIVRYTWSPGFYLDCSNCASPVSTPKKSMKYVVTVANSNGCTVKDTIAITMHCAESSVFIPNTFTPNKDGRNDLFYPRGKGIRLVKYFRVYNRLGELIFERSDFMINDSSQGWDGSYNGKMPANGVFAYTSEMICDLGELYLLKGNVTLIR
jgi:gliding motility-associated-like protein